MGKYTHYENVTREVLDKIEVGDFVRVNDWKRPMKVKAVSENYFVMTQTMFGKTYYSVCSKLPWGGIKHNAMTGGMFHCGTDDYVFGHPLSAGKKDLYQFNDHKTSMEYLKSFENKECAISERNGIPIFKIYIKKESK